MCPGPRASSIAQSRGCLRELLECSKIALKDLLGSSRVKWISLEKPHEMDSFELGDLGLLNVAVHSLAFPLEWRAGK